MHGQYAKNLEEAAADVEKTWNWLHQHDLTKEKKG